MANDAETFVDEFGTPEIEGEEELEETDIETETEDTTEEDTSDTDTETDETDEETAEEEDVDPLEKYGLKGKYKTPDDVFKAHKESMSVVENQRRENQELRNLFAQIAEQNKNKQDKPDQLSPEELVEMLNDNPAEALNQMGVVTTQQLETVVGQLNEIKQKNIRNDNIASIRKLEGLSDVADFMASNPDKLPPIGKNEVWDRMTEYARDHPGVGNLRFPDAMTMLYDIVSKDIIPKVPPVNPKKKSGASTSTGGNKVASKNLSMKEINNMTSTQMKDWARQQGYEVD